MIDLNVESITFQMHLKVEPDGSFKLVFSEGTASMSADEAPEMSTTKQITSTKELSEAQLGAPLSKMIRDAIHDCVKSEDPDLESKLCIKNLSKSNNMPDSSTHEHTPGKCVDPDCKDKNDDDWSWEYEANSN